MQQSRRHGITLLILLLVSVYTMTSAGRFHIVDEVSLFAVTESLALRGDVDTNIIAWSQWVNSPGEVLGAFGAEGEVYSKKGPAPAFLAVPWYMFLRVIALLDIELALLAGTLLGNGIVTAVTAGVLWLTVVRLGYRDRTGALLGLAFGLGTIAWPYANHFFGEPLSALSLLLAFYALLSWRHTRQPRWAALAGIGAGVVLATVTAHAPMIAILAVYGLMGFVAPSGSILPVENHNKRSVKQALVGAALFSAPIVIVGGLLLWYNLIRFGNPLDTGYHFDSGEGFTTPIEQGLWGLLASPYRGVFWHTPLFVATLFGLLPFWFRHKLEGTTVVSLSVTLVGLYSMWWMWWGGFAWGPRFLVPLSPFWVLLLAPLTERLTMPRERGSSAGGIIRTLISNLRAPGLAGWLLLIFLLPSTLVQLFAVSVNYVNYEIQLRSIFPTDWENPLEYGPPAQATTDLPYSPVLGQLRLIRQDFFANTDLAWLWSDGNIQWLVVLVGGACIATLAVALWAWWHRGNGDRASLSRPARWILYSLPLILLATWLSEIDGHPHFGESDIGYRAIISEICMEAAPNDVIVTIAPYAYQIPMNWLGGHCRYGLPVYGYVKDSLAHSEAQIALKRLLQAHDRIWFVTGGLPVNDPENSIERWLAEYAYKADDYWHEDYRLARYATPTQLNGLSDTRLSIPLTDGSGQVVTVQAARTPRVVKNGQAIPIDIHYEAVTPITGDLRWFVQLLSPDGYPVALLDTAPNDGYTQFSTTPVNQVLIELAGLQLPANIQPGVYQLIAGLYDPGSENTARLTTPDGTDFIELAKITVE